MGPWSRPCEMWVRKVRRGRSRSTTASASSRLKWVGCGSRRRASRISVSRPASSGQLSSGMRLTSVQYARSPTRNPRTGEPAVLQADRHDLLAQGLERHARGDPAEVDLGDVPRRQRGEPLVEGVVEDAADALLGLGLAVDRHRAADRPGEHPRVVEAEQVVGVVVRERDRVDVPDPLAEQLDAHLGRGVDQQVAAGQADQDAGAGPLVPRVVRGADRALAAEHRDARRGAGPQEHQPPRGRRRALHQAPIPPPRPRPAPAGPPRTDPLYGRAPPLATSDSAPARGLNPGGARG